MRGQLELDLNSVRSDDLRWQDGRSAISRHSRVETSRLHVGLVASSEAARFVKWHHASGSYPATRLDVGFFLRTGPQRHDLVGVACFSVPMSQGTIPAWTDRCPAAGVELGRFVLLDIAPLGRNAETWFLARALAALRKAKPEVEVVISFADPVPHRVRSRNGESAVIWGHVGTVYQAGNAAWLGRTKPRTLAIAATGQVLNERTLSKLRAGPGEQGYAYARAAVTEQIGVPPGWSDEAILAAVASRTQRLRHPGKHVFAWGMRKPMKADPRCYPKAPEPVVDVALTL